MPRSSAEVVRKLGFEIEAVRDIGMAAAKDREIIEYALRDNRIIIIREDDAKEIKEILDKALGSEELSSVIRRIREEGLH